MKISASIDNHDGTQFVRVATEGHEKSLQIPPKPDGFGSGVNGGELLFLALATCYCNDLYREARKRGIQIKRVQVEVSGEFGNEGDGARQVSYSASVDAQAPRDQILALMQHTDSVAEIQNTLRTATPVVLARCDANQV